MLKELLSSQIRSNSATLSVYYLENLVGYKNESF